MATSGLLLDFHGQRHLQNSTELGYVYRWDGQSIMYPKMLLRKSDLNEGNLPREGVSSVSSLLARFETPCCPMQIISFNPQDWLEPSTASQWP